MSTKCKYCDKEATIEGTLYCSWWTGTIDSYDFDFCSFDCVLENIEKIFPDNEINYRVGSLSLYKGKAYINLERETLEHLRSAGQYDTLNKEAYENLALFC